VAIIAALIGAFAVVLGVFIAQRLTDQRREREMRQAIGRNLKNQSAELVRLFQDRETSRDQRGREVTRVADLAEDLEAACAHMPKSRREGISRLIGELEAVLVNLPSWVERHGPLSDRDAVMVMNRTVILVLSAGEQAGVDPDEMQTRLDFYAKHGPSALRPGGPGFMVPPRGRWQRFKEAMVGNG
jgi:hypothetical protein